MDNDDGPPRALLIAALALAVGAIGAVVVIAVRSHPGPQPVDVVAVAAPQAQSPACRALLEELPAQLGDYQRAPTTQPTPAGTAAWRADSGGEPVVLRCGLDRPVDFVVSSPIQVVDAVRWFEVRQDDRSTWYAVDRPVYVALTLPPGSGPTPIQQLTELIDHTMAAVPIRPARA